MKFVNLTPRTLTIDGIGTLPPSGVVARLTYQREVCSPVGGVRCVRQDVGPIEHIPEETVGVIYLVSPVIVSAILARPEDPLSARLGRDLFTPDNGPDATRSRGEVLSYRGVVW